VRTALRRGLHAVLASKGPLVLAYQELVRLTGPGTLAFSGAVCGGLPTVNVVRRDLAASHIRRVDGIFNSTTQVILGLLAAGQPYTAALAEARRCGNAAPDPALDMDGWDAASKLVILANAVLGQPATLADVLVTGIGGVTAEAALAASTAGGRLSLLATAEESAGSYAPQVAPVALPAIPWPDWRSMRWPLSTTPTSTTGLW
jgi:homoserine dehydrogenase